MKLFCNNISDHIDMNIYKRGLFRMHGCSKYGKQNKLIFYEGHNYSYINEYQTFIDSCICSVKYDNPISITNNIEPIKIIKNKSHIYNNNFERNYIYKNYDINKIIEALNRIDLNDYLLWFKVTCAIKDLWLSTDKSEQDNIYKIYDDCCKECNNYDEHNNYQTFLNVEPKVDINFLFHLAGIEYNIKPLIDYKKVMFNINNHENNILHNSKYIDVNIDELLKYNIIYLKSPTGTGKTTILKDILKEIDCDNILSIVSRVNLAREHIKHIDLDCYKDIKSNEIKYSNRLAVQLESIYKIGYKNFKNGVVILDEINSLLSHLKSPTMNNIRSECYLYLCEVIKNAKYIIAMDADLSDWNIQFIKSIRKDNYIVYQNICKNKIDTNCTVYINDQVVVNKMAEHIKNNKPFVSCFDSKTKMNRVIEYLSKFGKKDEWKIYSADVEYSFINTQKWINKYVFYSPSILYGIDYNEIPTDVFSFTYKSHLNPLQVYQMISRTRKINELHVYCHNQSAHIKYNSVEDVEKEYNLFVNNFNYLMPSYSQHTDETSYKIMYFNFKYMDSLLKTNIKDYLIAIMTDIGFNIKYDNVITGSKLKKQCIEQNVKEKVVKLLKLNCEKLTPLQTQLCTFDKYLEKHFNLRIIINNNIDDKITTSICKNLFSETVKNKYTKIKIAQELMKVLKIKSFDRGKSPMHGATRL